MYDSMTDLGFWYFYDLVHYNLNSVTPDKLFSTFQTMWERVEISNNTSVTLKPSPPTQRPKHRRQNEPSASSNDTKTQFKDLFKIYLRNKKSRPFKKGHSYVNLHHWDLIVTKEPQGDAQPLSIRIFFRLKIIIIIKGYPFAFNFLGCTLSNGMFNSLALAKCQECHWFHWRNTCNTATNPTVPRESWNAWKSNSIWVTSAKPF